MRATGTSDTGAGTPGRRLWTSLVFGAVAALASIPWTMVTGSHFGRAWALAGYCLAAVVLYVVAIAPSWSRGVVIGALAALAGGGVAVLASWPAEALLGAAVILSVTRSVFLYRGAPARALLLEGALTVGGLLFARALAGPTLLDAALSVWAFFLVQSLFFLAGGVREREGEGPAVDPFERARKRAIALMEEL